MEKAEERVGGREQRKNHARKTEERGKKPLGLGWCWEGTERETEADRETEREQQRHRNGERQKETERWRNRDRERPLRAVPGREGEKS